jgi:Kef-type K+ transport system membrane component KefB
MRRLGLPAVVGGIFVGVLFGPSFFGVIPSEGRDPEGFGIVSDLADIGLCVLLFRIGLETRFRDFLPVWRQTASIAACGMVLPFALGWLSASTWGLSHQTAVFVGATLTATSIGVTASVLSELSAQRSKEGVLILGAAILDDVIGLVLLSSLVAIVTPALSVTGVVFKAILQAIGFIAAGILIGPYVVRIAVIISKWSRSRGMVLVLAFSYLLLLAYVAGAIGLDMIIGAYAAGLAFSHHDERDQLEQDLKPLTELLTPLFFVMLGASMEFSGLNPFSEVGRKAWGFASVLFIAAVMGKLFSAVWLRKDQGNKWAVGSGMMPRGEVGFIFAQIGLTGKMFSPELFSSIVAVLIGTTILGPVLLRASWKLRKS